MSTRWPKWITPGALGFLAIWAVLLAVGPRSLFRDPGTFWHTTAGLRMLSDRAVLRTDPFSFTRGGQPWTDSQWLAECGMALTYQTGGWGLLLVLTATILAGLYAWIGTRLMARGLHPLPAGLLLGLVLVASSHQFHVRPLVFTLALFAFTYALLLDIEAGRRPLGSLAIIPLATVVWTNLHGGVLAGLATLALVGAGWMAAGWLNWPTPLRRRRDAVFVVAIIAASAGATLVNPFGVELLRTWQTILSMPLGEIIQEHRPLDFHEPGSWLIVGLGLLYFTVLAGTLPARPRITWLVPGIWFVLALGRVRHSPLFGIAASLAMAEMLASERWAAWLVRRDWHWIPRPFSRRFSLIPPTAVVLAICVAVVSFDRLPWLGRSTFAFDPQRWPLAAVERLQRETQGARPVRVFNDMLFGGYLIATAPNCTVFIDDRCELYGTESLRAYHEASTTKPELVESWRKQYDFRYALVATGTPLDEYLRRAKGWRLLTQDSAAALYHAE